MIKYNLICKCGKTFESWFQSSSEYDSLQKKKFLKCIYCDSSLVRKTVMAPNLYGKSNKETKNLKSYLFAILGAEYILKWLPIGTHDWNKFLTPEHLEIIARKNNFIADEIVGMKFNLLSGKWNKSNDISVNYISTFLKN